MASALEDLPGLIISVDPNLPPKEPTAKESMQLPSTLSEQQQYQGYLGGHNLHTWFHGRDLRTMTH